MKLPMILTLTLSLAAFAAGAAPPDPADEPDDLFAEFPAIESWQAFSLGEEPDEEPVTIEDAGALEFGDTVGDDGVRLAADEAALLAALQREPTPERAAELARLRFAYATERVEQWRAGGDTQALAEALELAWSAVQLHDSVPVYWSLLGWLYAVAGDDPLMDALAERALLTALELEPAAPRARLLLAEVYLGRAEVDRALKHLHRLLETVPAQFSAEAIALTAKAYSEHGRAAQGAAFFAKLNPRPELDPVALRLALGALRMLGGEAGGEEMVKAVRDDPQASSGAREWAQNLLDPARMRSVMRASEPGDLVLRSEFWARIAESLLAVQDAALMFGLEVDEALAGQCVRLSAADPEVFAELFPVGRPAQETARAHAAFYHRVTAELNRLGPALHAAAPEVLEPLEAAVEEETDADEAMDAAAAVLEFYATLVEGLGEYLAFAPGNAGRLGAAGAEAVLDPLRSKLVAWYDFTLALEEHIAHLEAAVAAGEVQP